MLHDTNTTTQTEHENTKYIEIHSTKFMKQ